MPAEIVYRALTIDAEYPGKIVAQHANGRVDVELSETGVGETVRITNIEVVSDASKLRGGTCCLSEGINRDAEEAATHAR